MHTIHYNSDPWGWSVRNPLNTVVQVQLNCILHLKKKKNRLEIPVAITGWLFAEVWIFSEPWEVSCFSGGSAMTFASDGTRLARSGGWSFPTVGLACDNNTQRLNLTIILRKRANYEMTTYYLQINIGRGFSNWIQKLVKIMSINSCWANKLC